MDGLEESSVVLGTGVPDWSIEGVIKMSPSRNWKSFGVDMMIGCIDLCGEITSGATTVASVFLVAH